MMMINAVDTQYDSLDEESGQDHYLNTTNKTTSVDHRSGHPLSDQNGTIERNCCIETVFLSRLFNDSVSIETVERLCSLRQYVQ